MAEGIIKWFSDKKGYGFIAQEEGPDVFVHYTGINGDGFRSLQEGDRVMPWTFSACRRTITRPAIDNQQLI